jgi:hypothetical protein
MLLPSVTVRQSPIHGQGLFATAPIPAGCIVWHPCRECRVADAASVPQLDQREVDWLDEFGYRLVDGGLLLPCRSAYLMNHSCDAAVLDWGLDFGIAVRDIQAGEEVTCDFRTFLDDPPWTVACRCGAAECVGTIVPEQGSDPAVQKAWQRRVDHAVARLGRVAQPLDGSLRASSRLYGALMAGQRVSSVVPGANIRRPAFLFDL